MREIRGGKEKMEKEKIGRVRKTRDWKREKREG